MPVQEQPLNFEDLLHTVQESERGRWFLSEFENRIRKAETSHIFAAIQKLETIMAEHGKSGGDSLLVARARTAIAAARREIASIEGAKMSDEGRLFAKLADMARSAFTADGTPAPVNVGITRALRLVDQIEQELAPLPRADGGNAYFNADSSVFEAPNMPVMKPATPAIAAVKPAAPEVERGAKLLIRKSGEVEAYASAPPQTQAQPKAEPQVQTPPAPAAETPAASVQAAEPATGIASITPPAAKAPRVVIIRRKPEDLQDVPLVDETASGTAA